MPRELSDEEFAYYEGRRRVADFIETIYNDPALQKDAKRLIKRKYPTMAIADLDLEDKVEARFAEDQKRRDAEAKAAREAEEKKMQNGWKEQRDKVQTEWGFTDDAMKDLEKFMIARNVGDYEIAASYHAPKNPRASEPTSRHGEPWAHAQDDTFKLIAKDPEGWGKSELIKAIKIDQERARQAA
jgi:hypothetical protein